jgi:hypothetical protein
MCDFSGKLIAWLDHELPCDEAAGVEQHVQTCEDCRSSVDSYRQVTGAVEAYCDAVMALPAHGGVPRWAVMLGGAVVVAASLLMALSSAHVKQQVVHLPAAVAPTAAEAPVAKVVEPTPAPVKTIARRHAAAPRRVQEANWVQSEPAIHIAIPAAAMFPPGAVPEGVNLFAEVTIAADGSAQRLRLRP